eukprot:TRINITY_DN1066_c0_g1_i4.p1 TRINITY_DN1066_c0_g1~~TRINITY_DN1066_c0_g1_i4.p1  ORF type:complete len:480 (-),score=101.65 TRINITY_DN1066_c0_g1_i4:615-2054(-)
MMFCRQVLISAICHLLVVVDSSANDKDGSGNDTCIDVAPPNFDINVGCGSLVAALVDGCDDPILDNGNYCARSCQRNTCIDPLSVALFKSQKKPIDAESIGFNAPVVWLTEFGDDFDTIYVQDINGDKLSDIVAFGERGVYVALSTGTYFERPSLWSTDFGSSPRAGEWKTTLNPRLLGDVNGDGLSDVIGFYSDGTYVALNDGGTSFEPTQQWSTEYGVSRGWNNNTLLPRYIMDVDEDGKEDIIAFASSGLYVGLSNGSLFGDEKWSSNFGSNEYGKDSNPVIAADVNGDGVPDIVAFGDAHVDLSLNTGFSYAPKEPVFDAFSSQAGWRADRHLRFVQDIDNDGLADIVGMGDGGVFVSHSLGAEFEEPKLVIPDFGFYAGSWDVTNHVRMLVDVNGDGLLDIVGFKNKGVLISFNLGMGEFDLPFMAIDWFGYDMSAGGWDSRHSRFVSDVNGDGKGDIIGFAVEGVYVSTATLQ